MSWRDNLQPASFRGIPFKVDSATTKVGRRTEIHTYPLAYTGRGKKKEDYVETKDLGAAPDAFSIEGYVVQNLDNAWDYFDERNELIKALKTQGPGILIHPFYGTMKVSLDGQAEIAESITEEGGIARFTMDFVQYNEPIFAQLDTDYIEAVDLSVLEMVAAALDNFTKLMNTAAAFINSLAGPLLNMMNKIQNAVNAVKGAIASTISAVTGVLSAINSTLSSLLNSPCDLIGSIKDGAESVYGLVGMSGEILQGGVVGGCSGESRGDSITLDGTSIPEDLGSSLAESLANQADFDGSDVGSVPDEQADNYALMVATNQAMMLASAMRVAIRVEFSSQQQMEYIRNLIAQSLDSLLDRIGSLGDSVDDPLLYKYVVSARATFIRSMDDKNVGLNQEIIYEVPSGVMSTLELAYNKYEDVERCSEIFARNWGTIKHPGFMPSGEEINLLNE